jgi:hypothetical protein
VISNDEYPAHAMLPSVIDGPVQRLQSETNSMLEHFVNTRRSPAGLHAARQ